MNNPGGVSEPRLEASPNLRLTSALQQPSLRPDVAKHNRQHKTRMGRETKGRGIKNGIDLTKKRKENQTSQPERRLHYFCRFEVLVL